MTALWLRTTLRKQLLGHSKSDAGGLGEVCALSHTPTERVHGEAVLAWDTRNVPYPTQCKNALPSPETGQIPAPVGGGGVEQLVPLDHGIDGRGHHGGRGGDGKRKRDRYGQADKVASLSNIGPVPLPRSGVKPSFTHSTGEPDEAKVSVRFGGGGRNGASWQPDCPPYVCRVPQPLHPDPGRARIGRPAPVLV